MNAAFKLCETKGNHAVVNRKPLILKGRRRNSIYGWLSLSKKSKFCLNSRRDANGVKVLIKTATSQKEGWSEFHFHFERKHPCSLTQG